MRRQTASLIALFALVASFHQELFSDGGSRGPQEGNLNRENFSRGDFNNPRFERQEWKNAGSNNGGDSYVNPSYGDGDNSFPGEDYGYPPEDSSPGEGDDTDALYQYYLRQN